jgi:2,3-bisphosphoglycerate-independent phosphoglycerate mutase
MKYFILLGDGMADLPISELSGMTPLQFAHKPNIDYLAVSATCGMVQTIPEGMEPGSGPANMSVMGYDPNVYYTGRSPLEALSLGIEMAPTDMVFRCNLVSLSQPEPDRSESNKPEVSDADYCDLTMLDYSSGEISTEEASGLIAAIEKSLSSDDLHFFPGKSYRHCTVWQHGPGSMVLTPPHDISGRCIREYLPTGEGSDRILSLMKASQKILKDHPVNVRRREKGLNTADSIWLWGQGTKPAMADFTETYGRKGAVISAVDLIFGLGRCSGLELIEVPGATGRLDTNFAGKGQAAIDGFTSGLDYIYLHVEAPDECGHHGDAPGKVLSIERIDEYIAGPVMEYLEANRQKTGEDYKIMILPDHPTPVSIRTHSENPVPFLLYQSNAPVSSGVTNYCEDQAEKTGIRYGSGPSLFEAFIK